MNKLYMNNLFMLKNIIIEFMYRFNDLIFSIMEYYE